MSRVVNVTALIERISGTPEHPLDRLTSSRRRPPSVTGTRVEQRGQKAPEVVASTDERRRSSVAERLIRNEPPGPPESTQHLSVRETRGERVRLRQAVLNQSWLQVLARVHAYQVSSVSLAS